MHSQSPREPQRTLGTSRCREGDYPQVRHWSWGAHLGAKSDSGEAVLWEDVELTLLTVVLQ